MNFYKNGVKFILGFCESVNMYFKYFFLNFFFVLTIVDTTKSG